MRNLWQQGFTLIELMIVVTIIGLLAAIALPQYEDFTVQAKVSEGLKLADQVKVSVAAATQVLGRYASGGNSVANNSYGLPVATEIRGTYVSAVQVADSGGVIHIYYQNNLGDGINNLSITLRPSTARVGSITWTCKIDQAGYTRWVPVECR